jgi:DnaJ-class molecular chaperone
MLRGGNAFRRALQRPCRRIIALAGVCHYDILNVADNASEKEIRKVPYRERDKKTAENERKRGEAD